MAIKVVKEGEDLKAWRGTVTCHRCKSELEFDIEGVWASSSPGDAYDHWRFGVNCPRCSFSNEIDEKTLTEFGKHHIQVKYSRTSSYWD